jgi:hypothetical protein
LRVLVTPLEYVRGEKQPDLQMPDLAPVLKEKYAKYDSGAIGQFDTQMLLKQFHVENADQIATGWRGGMYYAGQRAKQDPQTPEDIALLYISYWRDAQAAEQYQNIYRDLLKSRYPDAKQLAAEGVRIVRSGSTLVITEGFDASTSSALEKTVFNPATPKVALDQHSMRDSLAHWAAMLHLGL